MRIYFLVTLLLASLFASGQNVGSLPNSILPIDTASYTVIAQPSATTLRKASLNRIFLTGKNYYDALYRPISYVPAWGDVTGKPTFSNGLTESGGTVKLGGSLVENTDLDFNELYKLSLIDMTAFGLNAIGSSGQFIDLIAQETGAAGYSQITLKPNGSRFNYFSGSVVSGDTYEANYDFGSEGLVQKFSKTITGTGRAVEVRVGGGADTESAIDGFHVYTSNSGYSVVDAGLKFRIMRTGEVTLNLGSDATGDIYRRNSSGYLSRLALGSALQVLRVNAGGTDIEWAAPSNYTDEQSQDAVGTMVDASLVYNDATPSLQRAALTGAITASAGSNSTSLGSFTSDALSSAISDKSRTITSNDDVDQADNNRTLYINSSSDINLTLDALTIGTEIFVMNIGTGNVTFVNGSGVTFDGDAILPGGMKATALIDYVSSTAPLVLQGGGSNITNQQRIQFTGVVSDYNQTIDWEPVATSSTSSGNQDFNIFFTDNVTNSTCAATVVVVGVNSDGTKSYSKEMKATFRKPGTSDLVQNGTTSDLYEDFTGLASTPTITVSASGDNLRVAYNSGDIGDTLKWTIFLTTKYATY